MSALLSIRDLSLGFGDGVAVLDRVGFDVPAGSLVALVGESGSGKTLIGLEVIGLAPVGARVTGGQILHEGRDLLTLGAAARADLRGRSIGMVFQAPRAALHPTRSIGRQIRAVMARHGTGGRVAPGGLLADLGIEAPERMLRLRAHELSGGMCQRAGIALALAAEPRLLIADEPTTGLDTVNAAGVMGLLRRAAHGRGMGVLLITHDLGLAAAHADRIVVIHAGQIAEEGPAAALLAAPRHPYARALLQSAPALAALAGPGARAILAGPTMAVLPLDALGAGGR